MERALAEPLPRAAARAGHRGSGDDRGVHIITSPSRRRHRRRAERRSPESVGRGGGTEPWVWTAGRSLRGKARQMYSKTQAGGRRRAPRIMVLLLALVTTLCAGLIGSAPAQAAAPEPSALSGT